MMISAGQAVHLPLLHAQHGRCPVALHPVEVPGDKAIIIDTNAWTVPPIQQSSLLAT